MTLTEYDTARLGKMLAEYEQATRDKRVTPTGTPVRLHIADDIVSQALDALLHDWLMMREIMQALAAMDGVICTCALGGSDADHERQGCLVAKARRLLTGGKA